MSIRDMVENSEPDEAARVAVDVARSVVARRTARADVLALAEAVLGLGDRQIAAGLLRHREKARESTNSVNRMAIPTCVARRAQGEPRATAHQIALSGLRLEGADLILTLTAPVQLASALEVVANGTIVEFRPAKGGEVVQAINLRRDITDAQVGWQIIDDGFEVRIHQYSDHPDPNR